MEGRKLYDRIIDKRNIYAAIYGMESYVFDKGLLDTKEPVMAYNPEIDSDEQIAKNDLELYYLLADKYNIPLFEKVLYVCQQKLNEILSDPEKLFKTRVYFKLKNYEEGNLSFRPLHTARLIDMICMVCILNGLMFDDDYENGSRKISDLAKLIPHNFYGNIPSTNVQYLFYRWQNKYKEYSDNVIDHCRKYQQNHAYLSEVCLDIKNFFPSISPEWLYNYIIKKIRNTYKEDIETLKMAVAKLLYFEIDAANMHGWESHYYPEGFVGTGDLYMNCGVPQGLPQSYFFGNLCMIEVKRILMEKKNFQGDAYFYVDDSVIYVQSQYELKSFEEKIEALNSEMADWCENQKKGEPVGEQYIAHRYLDFQKRLRYCIQFHKDGKSVCTPIDKTDRRYGLIAHFGAQASAASRILWGLDELDDKISLKKLKAINQVVDREIEEHKKDPKTKKSSRLKLLKRFKRFFVYRQRILTLRESGGSIADLYKEFRSRFFIDDIDKWFELTDEEIFASEYRLLMNQGTKNEAEDFCREIIDFESKIIKRATTEGEVGNEVYLYYAKDVRASIIMKRLMKDEYGYLRLWAKENYIGLKDLDSQERMKLFDHYIQNAVYDDKAPYVSNDMVKFVKATSDEYNRKIINAYFSELMSIRPSDDLIFTKSNSRKINYTELRTLAYLRNKQFNLHNFIDFSSKIDKDDVSNQMAIDMGLLSALAIFISYVKDPSRVDALILTHRITKGLWSNGSKFLHAYTLHNEEHAVTLINKSIDLTNRIDYFSLKDFDYFIMFLSCYLHDISMVIHPDLFELSSINNLSCYDFISDKMREMHKAVQNYGKVEIRDGGNARIKEAGTFIVTLFNEIYNYFENEVRSKHAKASASFILDREESLFSYLGPSILSYVAKVSKSHGADVYDVYGLKSRAKDDLISLKYLMLLIRLADLQDVANDRVNYYLLRQNISNLSLTSRFHWISHLVTDKIEIDADYDVVKHDEGKEVPEKSIIETINLNLYLNFRQQTETEKAMKCTGCICKPSENKIQIVIKGNTQSADVCRERCTVLCYWMMKKHEYLVEELKALYDYLNTVNNSLFESRINLNFIFQKEIGLDADMFSDIQEYLGI